MLQKRSKYIYMCVFFKRIENIYVENNFCLVTINTQSETSSALESRIPSWLLDFGSPIWNKIFSNS